MTILRFIHIAKCGGSTIHNIINKMDIKKKSYHLSKPKFKKDELYIICIRNPVERFVSAFNWRKKKRCQNVNSNEYQFLFKYKNINELAENLYKNGKLNQIAHNEIYSTKYFGSNMMSHFGRDIHWYLHDFLNKCNTYNILGVITIENMKKDCKKLFGININNIHKKKNIEYSKYLSKQGYKNLKKFLKKDYDCIDKLYKLKLISKKQYKLLLNDRNII